MRNLESSDFLAAPDLQKSEASGPDKSARYKFTMRVDQRKLAEEKAKEGDSGAAAKPTATTIPPAPAKGG